MSGAQLAHRLDQAARDATPAGLALACVLIAVVPVRVPEYAAVAPALALMAVFYWSLFRPELMPPVGCFAAGLFQDLLGAGPLGVGALVFLLVHMAVLGQRRLLLTAAFPVQWLAFALIAFAAFALTWFLVSAVNLDLFDPRIAAIQFVMTVALYPPVAWLCVRLDRGFVRRRS